MRHPNTKAQASEYEKEGIPWGVSKKIGQSMVHYLHDLGAKHDLPDDKSEVVEYVNRLHKKLTLHNAHFPDDIPFDIVYPAFMSAVLNGFVEIPDYQPHATKSQLSAFKKWITKGGQLDKLYERWYSKNPNARPKQIEGSTGDLESWDDYKLHEQYEKITQIMGKDLPLINTDGAKSYFSRVKTECQKRGLKNA